MVSDPPKLTKKRLDGAINYASVLEPEDYREMLPLILMVERVLNAPREMVLRNVMDEKVPTRVRTEQARMIDDPVDEE